MSKSQQYKLKSDGAFTAVRAADTFKLTLQASINGAAGVAAWTPAAGKQIRLMGLIADGSTAGEIVAYDNSVAGTAVAALGIAANASSQIMFDNGILISVGKPLTVKGPAGLASVIAYGTEEVPSTE